MAASSKRQTKCVSGVSSLYLGIFLVSLACVLLLRRVCQCGALVCGLVCRVVGGGPGGKEKEKYFY